MSEGECSEDDGDDSLNSTYGGNYTYICVDFEEELLVHVYLFWYGELS
eukprot:CAMPEP_0202734490 /NCGR_PEP_ID=MMETSP1385-20130828/188708_1 /ASSEMBLY_ACC=CAM_ASM_000861 /TAXON_ID=933848 /ORGANISM="Elphidium margaritaceum" /LENGTH=47 /DNA_ID= /DNA_START= /DNA_END= /DNA_ORIENTATION=